MKKLLIITIILVGMACLTGCDNGNNNSRTTWKCINVTSYDYNRNNDMKCISSHGDIQYTSYEGARVLESL